MKNKRILIVAPFTQLPGEKGNNRSRFKLLCELLASEGYEVTEVTSSFCDLSKNQRTINENDFIEEKYKIKILKDPGYKNPISIKRFYSQYMFAKHLKKWLKNEEKFDLIYVCIYPLESGHIILKFCKERNIPFIIDIQDLFPEVLKLILKNKLLYNIVTYPSRLYADNIYRNADQIVAVSETYLERALSVNKKSAKGICVFIGSDIEYFDKAVKSNNNKLIKNNEEFWITYIGSLSHSYDIISLIDAVEILKEKGIKNIKLNILGTGPLKEKFINYSNRKNLNINFTGWVSYETVAVYLSKSDILVNAIKKSAPQSITNKIGDYLSAGIPIINGSPNKEFINMIKNYNIGINYESENSIDMASSIEQIYYMKNDEKLAMGRRARELAEEKFDRKYSYKQIVELINETINLSNK